MWCQHHHTLAKHEDAMNIYVANLAFTTTEEELSQLFETYGIVGVCSGYVFM